MKRLKSFPSRLIALWGSPKFFYIIVGLLVVQALWIAFSNRYPMAFDEDYHFGIIKLYAHHLSPFWNGQPAGADGYGAVFRDPSYMYQYLMSFPYRLFSWFGWRQAVVVLWLRFINIALFASGLWVYRRLFQLSGTSRALTNICLLLFVLIPVVPLLAGQINYDNLFIPLVALLMVWLVRFSREVLTYKRINTRLLLQLLILCLFGSLVKFPFLPFFAAAALYCVIIFIISFEKVKKFGLSLGFGFTQMTKSYRAMMLLLLVLFSGLFLQRYAVNAVLYHTPVPDCSQVLSVQRCSTYGPWIRDYTLAASKSEAHESLIEYTGDWFNGMWLRLFFAVDGPDTQYETRGPLLLPGIGAIVFAVSSTLLVLRYARPLWKGYGRILAGVMLMVVVYVFSLWADDLRAFLRTGQPVAINGRYLLPVLPPLFLLAGLAWRQLLRDRYGLKVMVAAVALVCMIWGGGVLTFILRSSDYWYWQNATMRRLNADVRQDVGPAVPGYSNPVQFLP